jgi:hypothetical protein
VDALFGRIGRDFLRPIPYTEGGGHWSLTSFDPGLGGQSSTFLRGFSLAYRIQCIKLASITQQ